MTIIFYREDGGGFFLRNGIHVSARMMPYDIKPQYDEIVLLDAECFNIFHVTFMSHSSQQTAHNTDAVLLPCSLYQRYIHS
jgi:hypothetical protein